MASTTFGTSFGLTKCVMPNLRAIASRAGIDVDADDLVGADHLRALDHVEADAAEAEHDDVGAGLDLGREQHRADAGGDAAADVADLVERRVGADLRQRDLGHDGVVARRSRCPCSAGWACRRSRSGSCRRASGPCPAWRGSAGTGWSCATGRTCTGGIPACRAGSRGRRARAWSRRRRPRRTTPAPSWPRIAGKRPSGSAPDSVYSSVWQMPVALISTSTSPAFGPSRSTVSIVSGAPAFQATAARVFMRRACFPTVAGCGRPARAPPP